MTDAAIHALVGKRQQLLDSRPPYDAMIALVIEAWHTLDSCRSIGWVVGPIPYTAIVDWCDRNESLDDETRPMVIAAINYLDAERTAKSAAKRDTDKRQSPRSSR